MKRVIYQTKTLTTAIGTLFLTSNIYALPRCGVSDEYTDGTRVLKLHIPGLGPSDALNKANGAWEKIAKEAQRQYGGNVYAGQVTFVMTGTVFGRTVPVAGHFPFHFGGTTSIQKEILNTFSQVPPSSPDPAPCDPDKNACCDECGAAFASMNGINVFTRGYIPHYAEIQLRKISQKYGIVHGRPQHHDIELKA